MELLLEFGLSTAKPTSTLVTQGMKLDKMDGEPFDNACYEIPSTCWMPSIFNNGEGQHLLCHKPSPPISSKSLHDLLTSNEKDPSFHLKE